VSLLITCIQNVKLEDEDDVSDELSVSMSACCCLAAIAAYNGD
jgi:hypothetical protein